VEGRIGQAVSTLSLLGATNVTVNLGNLAKPTQSVVIIAVLTLLAAAPAALLLLTPFTQMLVTLKITANVFGIQDVPPTMILNGLALFLALAVMGPTIASIDHGALAPWLAGHLSFSRALRVAEGVERSFLLQHTRSQDLDLFRSALGATKVRAAKLPLSVDVPAYAISSLETAMLMGFLIYIPFVVVDLLVASTLMSTGIVMLPPTLISLPFKILLFVLVDGWGLVAAALLTGYHL
jgi:flagellar biosynthetic protein FliP